MMKGVKKAMDDAAIEAGGELERIYESGGTAGGPCWYFGFFCCLCTFCLSWIPFICQLKSLGKKATHLAKDIHNEEVKMAKARLFAGPKRG